MSNNLVDLRVQVRELKNIGQGIVSRAKLANRELTESEQKEFDDLVAKVEDLTARIDKLEALETPKQDGNRSWMPLRHEFSIGNAVRSFLTNGRVDGYEAELSQEYQRRSNKSGRPNGIFVPWRQRALTTTTGAGAVSTKTSDEYIDVLRRRTVADKLGCTVMEGLRGNVRIPRKTTSASVAWIGEGSNVSASNQEIDYVSLTPHTLASQVIYTRKFLLESNIDVERFITDDLTQTMARELDRVVFNGSGSGAEPAGLLQDAGLPKVALGANGGAFTWAKINELEQTLLDNFGVVNEDKVAFLTSNKGKKGLQTVTKDTSGTYPVYLYDSNEGRINGYPVFASNVIPSNLTKASGSNLTAALIGDFSQVMIGNYEESFLVLIDEYTRAGYGEVIITALFDMDTAARNIESFAAFVDVAVS